ncbi:serine hydrolase [Luteimonas sp. FCS-9]|uniref:serine hydrolase n=1 Tax=Luteimonas sp. FCS-9 TaxID=1547516 RepID=UPI000A7FDB9F|nr:serine hydrolase [Luteimonas sp. FCS-9]
MMAARRALRPRGEAPPRWGAMLRRNLVTVAGVAIAGLFAATAAAQPASPRPKMVADAALQGPPAWAAALDRRLRAVDARLSGEIGVYVQRLDDDATWGLRADESWYLASGVKVPIAIAVLREIEQGWLTLDTQVALRDDDFVDGAGGTNAHRAGARLPIAYLLEEMIVHSDNTASDVLIRTVGLGQVNAVAAELIAAQGVRITTLSDVRRRAYGMLHPAAAGLSSQDLLALQRAGPGQARVRRLADLLDVPASDFLLPDLDSAFESYYATHVNSATLRDYGRMLAALQRGQALDPAGTRQLLGLMARVQTGTRRIRAGLPPGTRFAHKTGTQYRRLCDSGIATLPGAPAHPAIDVVIVACVRGADTQAGERALREIGAAVAAAKIPSAAAPPPEVHR